MFDVVLSRRCRLSEQKQQDAESRPTCSLSWYTPSRSTVASTAAPLGKRWTFSCLSFWRSMQCRNPDFKQISKQQISNRPPLFFFYPIVVSPREQRVLKLSVCVCTDAPVFPYNAIATLLPHLRLNADTTSPSMMEGITEWGGWLGLERARISPYNCYLIKSTRTDSFAHAHRASENVDYGEWTSWLMSPTWPPVPIGCVTRQCQLQRPATHVLIPLITRGWFTVTEHGLVPCSHELVRRTWISAYLSEGFFVEDLLAGADVKRDVSCLVSQAPPFVQRLGFL